MRSIDKGSPRALLCVSLLSVSAIAVAVGGIASASTASRSLIEIHEQGKNLVNRPGVTGSVRGTFTIQLKKAPFGPGGTTVVFAEPAKTRLVNGQEQTSFVASDRLTSKTGTIEIAAKGIHIDVNSKLSPAGRRVAPAAEYGTWKIRAATGIYEGWTGGGNFASVAYGYGSVEPYSVEWDGYITTP
jgi:hypothetical protein